MNYKPLFLSVIFTMLAFFSGNSLANTLGEDIAEKGNSKGAVACKTCHGDKGQGNAAAAYPYLAGQPAAYLAKQLNDFANNQRSSAVMVSFAKSLSEKEIKAVAEYYAKMEFAVSSDNMDAKNLPTRGKALALQGKWSVGVPACFQCHGSQGQGIAPHFPAISGQPVQYLQKQLEQWSKNQRGNDPGGLMKAVVNQLDDKDIEAVSQYISNLSPVENKK